MLHLSLFIQWRIIFVSMQTLGLVIVMAKQYWLHNLLP